MVASGQSAATKLHRDAWVEVDLGALENNLRVIRSWLSAAAGLMAVVKTDAYGHGAVEVAPVLLAAGASWLGVATVDEGLELRDAGMRAPILMLSPCPFSAAAEALEAKLDFTVASQAQVNDLIRIALATGRTARVHLKVDTGMHRLGVNPRDAASLAATISAERALELVGVYSHLARAEEPSTTSGQNNNFQKVLQSLTDGRVNPPMIHLASGGVARRFPDTHYDLVRVGLYMYGLEPRAVSDVVTPALSLRARINQLKEIEPGESVGYDLTWTAERRSRIASVPVGYGDGVDRGLSNRMTALLGGMEIKQVGLISMDQMLFDVTDLPHVQEGDVITLIGSETGLAHPGTGAANSQVAINLADWALMLDTITYELVCRLRVRLPTIYTRQRFAL